MASKTKNAPEAHFPGRGGGGGGGDTGVRDMAQPSQGNLGAKLSKTSFPHFKTYFMQIELCYL